MTRPVVRGLIVAALHVGLAASLGAKLLIDRANYPRAWARTAPFDPNLPIRGRYVRLRLEASAGPGLEPAPGDARDPRRRPGAATQRVRLASENGALVALPADADAALFAEIVERDGELRALLMTPVAFFIPDDVPDPSIRPAGEELWVEVTLPQRGAPRPIRLEVRKAGG